MKMTLSHNDARKTNKKHIKHSGRTAQNTNTHSKEQESTLCIIHKKKNYGNTENGRNPMGHRLGTVSGKNVTGEFK